MMRWIILTVIFASFLVGWALAEDERPSGWQAESHGNGTEANYAVVLPEDRVNEITIVFRPEEWAAEIADMTEIYGERDTRQGIGQLAALPPGDLFQLDIDNLDLVAIAAETGVDLERLEAAVGYWPNIPAVLQRLGSVDLMQLAGAIGIFPSAVPTGVPDRRGGDDLLAIGRNPIWVAADVHFEGQTWWEVGFRFKGNSSLASGWGDGTVGLPFKLDFDEFEDDHPAIDNQRFFGFKQLSFSNNWNDPSLQRDAVAAEVFRASGVVAARTAFYSVHVDIGDGSGPVFWGMYTALELPDDTLIETQFSDDDGNMYKPEGSGATFAEGSFHEESFDKETNRDSGYEDILALFDALHAETRRSDPVSWRAGLEQIFAVDVFLRWLATNQLIQNWDSYGVIAHNYYLYADPAAGQLTWIPWDHNLAFRGEMSGRVGWAAAPEDSEPPPSGARGLGLGGSAGNRRARISQMGIARGIALDDVDEGWPLIRFLLDDEVYGLRYREYIAEVAETLFHAARMTPIYEANYEMLATHLREKVGASEAELVALRQATDELIAHVLGREQAAAEYIAHFSANSEADEGTD